MNQNSTHQPAPPRGGVRLGAHWRTVSWAMLDKSLPVFFGLAFLLLAVRVLPAEEFALQVVASALLLTISQTLRALLLVPLVRMVGEHAAVGRAGATGLVLYVGASVIAALLLGGGRELWAAAFDKPDLAAVLVPSAWLLAAGSARDAAVACFEGLRRLRRVFVLDAVYFAAAIAALAVWRTAPGPRTATAVQWIQAGAAAFGTLVALVAARRLLVVRPERAAARRILSFGAAFLGSSLGATLSQQADTLLAGRIMDAPGVAAYGAARLLFRVFNVLAQAVSQVLFPTVARLHAAGRRDDLRALFEKSVCFLTLALVPAGAVIVLATAPFLRLLFDGRYDAAVQPFQILVAGAVVSLPLASVGSPFLTGIGRLRSLLWITWLGVVVGVGLSLAWTPVAGPRGAAAAAATAAVVGMVARAWVLRPALGFRWSGIAARSRDVWAFARARFGRAAGD